MDVAITSTLSLPSAPSPLLTAVSNGLRLLSPQTWLGLMQVSSRSPLSEFQLETLAFAIFGAVFPIAVLYFATQHLESMRNTRPQLGRVLVLSPWVWQCIWQVCLQMRKFAMTMISNIRNRSKPLPLAIQELQTRLSSQRAYRTRRYTVYLPTPNVLQSFRRASAGDVMHPAKILVFFPGALVPSEAYSELAGRISDNGLVVIVPSLQPCLFAAPNLGTDVQKVCRTMKKVPAELKLDPNHIEWVLGGHSMGAFGAMRLYDQFQKGRHHIFIQKKQQLRINNMVLEKIIPLRIKDLVLIGVTPFLRECTNLSSYNDVRTNRILLIQATDDVLMKILGDGIDELYMNFPDATTIRKDVIGGTHHGFASYNDANGQITMPEQQSQTCDHIADFLQLKINN